MNERTWSKNRTRELINDLSAVRAAVMSQSQADSPADRAALEDRLFESWVIEKLVQSEFKLVAMGEELSDLQDDFEALKKSIPRPPRKSKKDKGE